MKTIDKILRDLGRTHPTVITEETIAQARQEIIAWVVEGMLPKIDDWQCDNISCGKGAICNFCALKNQLTQIKEKLKGE